MSIETLLKAHGWPTGSSESETRENTIAALEMTFSTIEDVEEILGQHRSDAEKLHLIALAVARCTPEMVVRVADFQTEVRTDPRTR